MTALDVLANFTLFVATAGFGTGLATYLAFVEDHRRMSRLAFDITRSIGITQGGWLTVALAVLLNPDGLGASAFVPPTVMATPTLLCFLSIAIGWTSFLVFQWQGLHGHHPWQREQQQEGRI